MKALSIRQPWAWLIVNGYKDIENRTWPTKFRGEFLVHASKGMTKAEYDDVVDFIRTFKFNIELPQMADLQRGGIVGVAEIVDCANDSMSEWFFGDFGFVLAKARPVEFQPLLGKLGFFDTPYGDEPPKLPTKTNLNVAHEESTKEIS